MTLLVSFVVTFQKDRFDISLPSTATVANLKERLATLTNVPKENQKLMFKGISMVFSLILTDCRNAEG